MAKSQFLGFDRSKNLSESDSPDSDISIVNNLGGGSIADDLLRFFNNKRNVSTLTVSASNISSNTVTFSDKEFVYTNGTKITVGSDTYYVRDSDGYSTFRLSANSTLSGIVTPPVGVYQRSDEITLDNIKSLAYERKRTVEDLSESRILDNYTDANSRDRVYSSLIAAYNAYFSGFPSTTGAYFTAIDNNIDYFNLKRKTSIVKDKDFSTSYPLTFTGSVKVIDTSGLNNTTLSANTNPGLFIVNPQSGVYTRAFSSNENLWSENNANLVVSSASITVGTLDFTGAQGLSLLTKASANLVINTASSANLDFTHSVDITIDGEAYSLCLTYEP